MPGRFSVALTSPEAIDLSDRFGLTLPVHSLVSDKAHICTKRKDVIQHTFPILCGEDVLYRVHPGLLVCSPELVFLQLAGVLALPDLIALGFELCGCYSIRPEGTDYHREPLTSVVALSKTIEMHSAFRGVRNARRAIRFVRDNSNSPMETVLALLLGLPCNMGGCGFGLPAMNREIVLSEEARQIAYQRTCKCDLYYSNRRVDLEYESYEFHSGAKKMERDSLRRGALALMGVKVVTVTYQQIADPVRFAALARLVSKSLGVRFRPQCRDFEEKQFRLRRALLGQCGSSAP